jgi:hypothetical protein
MKTSSRSWPPRSMAIAPLSPQCRVISQSARLDYTRFESPTWRRKLTRLAAQALSAKLLEMGE